MSWKLASPSVYFSLPSLILQITGLTVVAAFFQKKPHKLWQQKEVVTHSAARGTCNDLSSNQLQVVTPKPHNPSPPKPAALVCHLPLAAPKGCVLPGLGTKPSLALRGRSWLSTTGQGHFSGGIWKGTWLVEAGQALKGSICSFHYGFKLPLPWSQRGLPFVKINVKMQRLGENMSQIERPHLPSSHSG